MGFGQFPTFDKKNFVIGLGGVNYDIKSQADLDKLAKMYKGEGTLLFNKQTRLWEYKSPDRPYKTERIANEVINFQNAFKSRKLGG